MASESTNRVSRSLAELDASFSTVLAIVQSAGASVSELIRLRQRRGIYEDVVDNYVFDIWAKVLTTADLKRAFEDSFPYVVKQAYWALAWYQKVEDVEVPNPRSPSGFEVKKVPNASLFESPPPVAVFDFAEAFISNYSKEIDDFFISEGFIDVQDDEGDTALIYSAYVASDLLPMYLERVKRLLDNGAKVNIQNRYGFTALMLAAKERRRQDQDAVPTGLKVVELLVKHGASLDIANVEGNTAILVASRGDPDDRHLMSLRDLSKIAIGKRSSVPVAFSEANKQDWSIVEYLAKAGANIDIAFRGGSRFDVTIRSFMQVITNSVMSGEYDKGLVLALLSGTRISLNNAVVHGMTPIMLVVEGLWERVGEVRPDRDPRLVPDAAIGPVADVVRAMTKHSLNLRATDQRGMTVFHYAYEPTTLKILLEYAKNTAQLGAIKVLNSNQETPLSRLAKQYVKVMKVRPSKRSQEVMQYLKTSGQLLLSYGAEQVYEDQDTFGVRRDEFLDSVFKAGRKPTVAEEHDAFLETIQELAKKFTKQEAEAIINAVFDKDNRSVPSETIFNLSLSLDVLARIANTLGYNYDNTLSKVGIVRSLVDQRNRKLGISAPASAASSRQRG